MKYHRRLYYTAEQRAEIWDRWQTSATVVPSIALLNNKRLLGVREFGRSHRVHSFSS
jgi:hypothetical protein